MVTSMDQPKSNTQRADQPLLTGSFRSVGPCKQPSFAGHSYCVILIDDCTWYRAEFRSSFITTTVRDESQVKQHGRHR